MPDVVLPEIPRPTATQWSHLKDPNDLLKKIHERLTTCSKEEQGPWLQTLANFVSLMEKGSSEILNARLCTVSALEKSMRHGR